MSSNQLIKGPEYFNMQIKMPSISEYGDETSLIVANLKTKFHSRIKKVTTVQINQVLTCFIIRLIKREKSGLYCKDHIIQMITYTLNDDRP